MDDFLNVNVFFDCKYKCEYEKLFIEIYICSVSLKTLFFIASLGQSLISEILILKIEMLLVFQNKTNIEIIGF